MENNRVEQWVRPNILALKSYVSFRDSIQSDAYLKFDANENPFGDYNRYPDSTQSKLRERLAQIKSVSSAQIAIGNGSDELIDLIIKIFCRPGKDAIAVMKPSFAMYEFYANINENEVIEIELDANFCLTKEEFLSKTKESNAKVLFLCSPNNPTGNSITDLEFYIKNFEGIVVVDEAYIEFSSQDSILSKLKEYDNLIVLQTLSKAWGLAGLRVGMAFAHQEILDLMNKVKPPYNISILNQKEVYQSLQNQEKFRKNLDDILEQRNFIEKQLQSFSFVKNIYPSDANFLLVEVENADQLYNYLVEEKIIIRNRNKVVENCVRITIGNTEENQKLLQSLKNYKN